MNNKLKNGIALSLPLQIILVKMLATRPEWVETYYSNGIYPFLSQFFRTVFGWIPFSVGDLLYAGLIFFALRYVILNRLKIKAQPLTFLRNIAVVLSIAYFTFHLVWGMNYYREPIHKSLHIDELHTDEELHEFVLELIKKTNSVHASITKDTTKAVVIPYSKSEIFSKTEAGYKKLANEYEFLKYNRPSLKTSLFSTGLTYAGYAGYINPFTNEAQVNSKIPLQRFPVVTAHEAGHQVGYSAENETNFIGYLVTVKNDDLYFKYSAYSYALSYCLGNIRAYDEAEFNLLYKQVNVGIKKNYQEMTDFWMAYENPIEPVFESIFNTFLKANNQSDGMKSYSRIVSLLVTYHQDHPL